MLLAVGGGIAIGLLILTWWLIVQRGFSWALGFLVLAIVLFALFVWPTRYRYESFEKSEIQCKLLRVERLTGRSECILPPSSK